MPNLNTRELRAIATIVKEFSFREREDLMGGFIKTGAFHHLTDMEIVELSKKLERAMHESWCVVVRVGDGQPEPPLPEAMKSRVRQQGAWPYLVLCDDEAEARLLEENLTSKGYAARAQETYAGSTEKRASG